MTDKLEQVSALADEQWDDKAIDALLADPELQAQWARHHQIKDALQGEDVSLAGADFASKVSAAIAEEPTVLAPNSQATEPTQKSASNVVSFFRRAGQYAIAASVALVAIVGVQQMGQESVEESPLPVLNTNPVVGVSATPVSLSAPSPQPSAVMPPHQTREQFIEQKRRINAYFQDHELQQRIQQPAYPEQKQDSEEESQAEQ